MFRLLSGLLNRSSGKMVHLYQSDIPQGNWLKSLDLPRNWERMTGDDNEITLENYNVLRWIEDF